MNEYTAWVMYFSGLVAFAQHPGNQREGTRAPTIPECADIADAMLEETRKRWRGLDPL